MRNNYDISLQMILKIEGGYVNNVNDKGGPTNCGITQSTYDAYRISHGLPPRSVKSGITAQEIESIYRRDYAQPIKFDDLPRGLDFAVFDFAVHSGAARSAKELQRVLGVRVDGVIGSKTLAACRDYPQTGILIKKFMAARLGFLKTLSSWKYFEKGWGNRVLTVSKTAIDMSNAQCVSFSDLAQEKGKAYEVS